MPDFSRLTIRDVKSTLGISSRFQVVSNEAGQLKDGVISVVDSRPSRENWQLLPSCPSIHALAASCLLPGQREGILGVYPSIVTTFMVT